MAKNKSIAGIGIGGLGLLAVLLTVLFVGLKLTGFIAWSWLWVISPIPIAIVGSVVLVVGLIVGVVAFVIFILAVVFIGALFVGLIAGLLEASEKAQRRERLRQSGLDLSGIDFENMRRVNTRK